MMMIVLYDVCSLWRFIALILQTSDESGGGGALVLVSLEFDSCKWGGTSHTRSGGLERGYL